MFRHVKDNWLIIALAFISIASLAFIGIHQFDQYAYDSPGFCASCHNMEKHVATYLDSNYMDHVHFEANVMCKDCHFDYTIKDELTSVVKYISGDYDKVFSQHKFDDQMCLNCHISLDYHADRTDNLRRNPHLSHWPELRCGSCHISHGEQVDYCSRCHDNGGQRMTGGEIIARSDNPWNKK